MLKRLIVPFCFVRDKMKHKHLNRFGVVVVFFMLCSTFSAQTPLPGGSKKASNPSDVPVIQPKKADQPPQVPTPPVAKEKEVPLISGMEDQAILPIVLVKNKVETLKVGFSAYTVVESLRIDSRRRCWLHPHGIIGTRNAERVIQVKHDTEGYHVLLEKTDHQWEARDVDNNLVKWIPVKTLILKE